MPAGIFGIYQTEKNPMTDSGIAGFLSQLAGKLAIDDDGYLYSDDVLGVDDDKEGSSGSSGAYAVALEAAESMQSASDNLSGINFSRRR